MLVYIISSFVYCWVCNLHSSFFISAHILKCEEGRRHRKFKTESQSGTSYPPPFSGFTTQPWSNISQPHKSSVNTTRMELTVTCPRVSTFSTILLLPILRYLLKWIIDQNTLLRVYFRVINMKLQFNSHLPFTSGSILETFSPEKFDCSNKVKYLETLRIFSYGISDTWPFIYFVCLFVFICLFLTFERQL